jgi:pseudouridine synthase
MARRVSMTSGDPGEVHDSDDAGTAAEPSHEGERLQKVMAAAGVASRRVSEDLIAAGRVSVNGEIVTEPGRRVRPTDSVSVDGSAIQLDPTRRYLMLNKPVGIVSSLADENGRPDLSLYTRDFDERLFNVGRLDAQTSGLLVLTNDGELAHVLSHPSFGVSKTYIAKVQGEVSAATLRRLTSGIDLDDGPIAADRAKLLGKPSRGQSMVEVELHSGRNRIVRRMFAAIGHPVVELVRRQFGPLTLGSLGSGQLRDLTKVELGQLLTLSRAANAEPSDGTSDDQPRAPLIDNQDDSASDRAQPKRRDGR